MEEGEFEGLVGGEDVVGDALDVAEFFEAGLVGVDAGQIIGTGFLRVDVNVGAGFEVFELGAGFETEFEFVAVEDLEDDDFVAEGAELSELVFELFNGTQQVGDEDH